jgi:cold shock CspA family protein
VRSFLTPLVAQEKGGKKCFVFGSEVYEELGQLGEGPGVTFLLESPIQGSSLL